MKSKILVLSFFILGFLTVTAAGNPVSKFNGKWVNVNSSTRGITKLMISANGITPYIQAYGSCKPKDCDWGKKKTLAYGNSVSSNLAKDTEYLSVNYTESFKNTLLLIRFEGAYLEVTTLTNFKDRSKRSNYVTVERFKKSIISLPRPTINNCAKEDCLAFNPNGGLKVIKNSKGTYTVAQGSRYLFAAPNKLEAEKIIKLVKRYGFTSSCFVGRPNPNFKYLLKNGKTAVVKPSSNEDIISFNPATTKVSLLKGNYKIVDGSHWIFDFGKNKKEAIQALCIIKKYKFNGVGFVGRPNASFQYMVRK